MPHITHYTQHSLVHSDEKVVIQYEAYKVLHIGYSSSDGSS
jgi:hypothetical protein